MSEAGCIYHRLVPAVGGTRTGRTVAPRQLAESRGWPRINVSPRLAEPLLEPTRKLTVGLVREVEELPTPVVRRVTPFTSHPGKAEILHGAGHARREDVRGRRGEPLAGIGSSKHRADAKFQRHLGKTLA